MKACVRADVFNSRHRVLVSALPVGTVAIAAVDVVAVMKVAQAAAAWVTLMHTQSIRPVPSPQRAIGAVEEDNAGGRRPQARLDQPSYALPPRLLGLMKIVHGEVVARWVRCGELLPRGPKRVPDLCLRAPREQGWRKRKSARTAGQSARAGMGSGSTGWNQVCRNGQSTFRLKTPVEAGHPLVIAGFGCCHFWRSAENKKQNKQKKLSRHPGPGRK